MRRFFIRNGCTVSGCIVPITLFLSVIVLPSCSVGELASRPNVLLVVFDTTRADVCSLYGYHKPTTPEIDKLARRGVRYDLAFSTSFWTLPSHASLFTGLYPSEAGATSETVYLPSGVTTIAERFRTADYRTRAAVANAWITRERGFGQGFEEFLESWRNTPERQSGPPVKEVLQWIDEFSENNEPFFLFINLNTPHLPYKPPKEVREEFFTEQWSKQRLQKAMNVRGPLAFLTGTLELDALDFEAMRDLYAAEVHRADRVLGRMVAALESKGMLENTLVVVTSDHGENVGDHGLVDHLLSMYDTTIRIPLVIRFPERFQAGTVVKDLISLVDLMPTIMDVCGLSESLEEDSLIRSRSLCSDERTRRRAVFAENGRPVKALESLRKYFPEFDADTIDHLTRMIRTEQHKLIWNVDRELELYDLQSDGNEMNNVVGSFPEIESRLMTELQEWMSGLRPPEFLEPLESMDEEALETLRSLGYVE